MKTISSTCLRTALFFAALLLFVTAPSGLFGADLYWNNTQSGWLKNNAWSTAAGTPTGNTHPGILDMAYFSSSTVTNAPVSVQLSSSEEALGLTFLGSNAGTTTLRDAQNGKSTLLLGANGITVNSGAGATTLDALSVSLAANQTWANNSANELIVSAGINKSLLALSTFTLTVGGSGNTSISEAASGTGGITKTGAGTLTLTGANTYTGATTINGGTLSVSTNAAVAATSGISMSNSTFAYTGAAATINRNFTVTGGTGTLHNSGGGTLTLSGTLSKNGTTLQFAEGAFNVTGAITGASANSDLVVDNATVTLSSANTFNGPIYIRNAGVLNANVAGALPTATRSAVILDDIGTGGSSLSLGASQQIASLTGADSSDVVSIGANTLTIGTTSGSTTFAGAISGAGSLVKDGASTQILTGANTYTGSTTISAGTLQIGDGNLGASIASTSAITNNGSLVFKVGSATHATTAVVGAQISGTGSVTQDSPGGIVFLDNENTYSGGTTIIAGELHARTVSSLGSGSVTLAGTNAVEMAKLHYSNAVAPMSIGALTLAGNAMVDLELLNSIQSTGAISITGNNNFISLGGGNWNATNTLIAGTSLTLGSGASITLTGPVINDTTLALGSSTTIGRSTYTFGSNATSFFLLQAGTNLDLLWTGAHNNQWNSSSDNWVNAPGGLNPSGTNIAFATDDNIYFGSAAAAGGPITADAAGVSAANMHATNASGTVVLNGGNVFAHTLTKTGAGDLVISNALKLIGNNAALTNGILDNSGSGNVTVQGRFEQGRILQTGTGTVTLGASNSFVGGTVISNGTVAATADHGLGSGALTVSGGTADVGGTSQSLGQVTLESGSITGSGSITSTKTYQVQDGSISANLGGASGLTKTTAGTVTLGGNNTYTGLTHVDGGTLQVSADANLGNAANGLHLEDGTLKTTANVNSGRAVTLTRDGTFDTAGNAVALSGVIEGGGALIKAGAGTLTLSGANTYSGGTTVSAGTLSGDATSLQEAIANNAAVVFNQTTDGTYAGNMTGTGSLSKAGAGTLTVTGNNSYSGGTTVSAGRVVGNVSSLQGAIANEAAVEFQQTTDGTYTGAMSGGGTLEKTGSAALKVTGTSSLSGHTKVSGGRLSVEGSLADSTVTVEDGATLSGSGTVGVTVVNAGATISPGNSPGTLTIDGNLTWNNGGNYDWEVFRLPGEGTAGTDWDLLSVNGSLNLTNLTGAPLFNINLYSMSATNAYGPLANWSPTGTYAWKILQAASAIDQTYISASYIGINTENFSNTAPGLFGLELRDNDTGLYLTYKGGAEPVPEPGTWAAAALLLGGAGFMRWRKRAKCA